MRRQIFLKLQRSWIIFNIQALSFKFRRIQFLNTFERIAGKQNRANISINFILFVSIRQVKQKGCWIKFVDFDHIFNPFICHLRKLKSQFRCNRKIRFFKFRNFALLIFVLKKGTKCLVTVILRHFNLNLVEFYLLGNKVFSHQF